MIQRILVCIEGECFRYGSDFYINVSIYFSNLVQHIDMSKNRIIWNIR